MGIADEFRADAAFESGSVEVADWALSQVRLQDDARFPWLILIPRRAGLTELDELEPSDLSMLMSEVLIAGDAVRALGRMIDRPVEKLNVAALGNVTAQLHVHVIGRRADDPVWPDPVWGRGSAVPWAPDLRETLIQALRRPA
ncbi:MAG: HIT domain-containing protein [Brevundimonas sp.]|uniref:HIT domain-containing protein n=1 Tax=Brevundimonas sp. TaxID=1871086 RepID=UPI001A277B9B|nr:HIT domain-containing protein [Brevundimonas sp.]MBJ7446310.1 HIT domain-containing protein [Brevundimonas sp.]